MVDLFGLNKEVEHVISKIFDISNLINTPLDGGEQTPEQILVKLDKKMTSLAKITGTFCVLQFNEFSRHTVLGGS